MIQNWQKFVLTPKLNMSNYIMSCDPIINDPTIYTFKVDWEIVSIKNYTRKEKIKRLFNI